MAAEWRVLVVKLADRTHNMRTLGAMPAHKREKKAKETLALFVPLARQLGAASVERELYKLSTANIPSFATDDNKLDEWLQDEQIAELQIGSRLARHRQRWEAHCAAAEGRGCARLCARARSDARGRGEWGGWGMYIGPRSPALVDVWMIVNIYACEKIEKTCAGEGSTGDHQFVHAPRLPNS